MRRYDGTLLSFVDIGDNRNVVVKLFDFIKCPQSLFNAHAARAVERRAVGFVERCFEHVIYTKSFGDFNHRTAHIYGMLTALNLAWAGKKRKRQVGSVEIPQEAFLAILQVDDKK